MALQATPESSQGVFGAIKNALGLFSDTNKVENVTRDEQPIEQDEYTSKFTDEEILTLAKQWKQTYSVYYDPIEKSQQLAFDYWVGKHRSPDGTSTMLDGEINKDNLIFEAVETFLPIATRANPDPVVTADPSEAGQAAAHAIKAALVNEADVQKLRRKLAKTTRHWLLNRIGVVCVSWDTTTSSIKTEVVHPKEMIFDKDGFIDEGGIFRGEYVGRKKKASARKLIEMFPKSKEFITQYAKRKMGTKINYMEWWYKDTDIFYVLEDEILGKFKNPNWNYDNEDGTQGTNHLKEITNPFRFLAIFNTGIQPHDETGLVIQNIPGQDRINKRVAQIDKNVDGMNNGMVVSGGAFTEEQAAQAASALRRGVAIRVPNGDVNGAVMRFPAPALPNDVFNSLQDGRNELRNIFGTAGSSAEGVKKQESVRGKIMVNQMDSSRIGGGVTEYIEQLADSIYNLWVQMMFVYYDDEHYVLAAGAVNGAELITIKNTNFQALQSLNVTVKEGSLIPKDPLTQRNEAIDLWSAGAIDPRTLFKKLDYPDPNEATKQLLLWQLVQKGALPPQAYIPDFQVPPQALPQQGVGGPAVNPLGPPEQQPAPEQGTPDAVAQQSKQLLQQIPV